MINESLVQITCLLGMGRHRRVHISRLPKETFDSHAERRAPIPSHMRAWVGLCAVKRDSSALNQIQNVLVPYISAPRTHNPHSLLQLKMGTMPLWLCSCLRITAALALLVWPPNYRLLQLFLTPLCQHSLGAYVYPSTRANGAVCNC